MSLLFRLASCCLVLAASVSCAAPLLARHEFEERAMGTLFRVVVYAPSRASAEDGAAAAFARVHALDAALSDYREDSELSRVGARSDAGAPTEWIEVSSDFAAVLERAQVLARASDGAFDVTAGPVVALWRRARRQGEVPARERIEAALAAVGWRKLELDAGARRVRLLAPRMRLDLGGIAKGYAVERALDALAERGLERALVVGGGDVGVRRAPPGERGWRVDLAPLDERGPRTTIELEFGAVSTSGDALQALELGAQRYSHIVDPRTGWALTSRTSATVIAGDATTSDALATTLCVLGSERAVAWAQRFGGIEARVTRELDLRLESAATAGFAPLILGASSTPRADAHSRP